MGSCKKIIIVIYIEKGLVGFGIFLTAVFVASTFFVEDMIVEAQPEEEREGVRLWLGSVFTGIFVLMLGSSLVAAILTSVLKKGYEEKCADKLKGWLVTHVLLYLITLIGGFLVILKDPFLYLGSIPTWIMLPYQVWSFLVVNDFRNEIRYETREEFEVVEFDEDPDADPEPEPYQNQDQDEDDPIELES